jgi:hypothetical protein
VGAPPSAALGRAVGPSPTTAPGRGWGHRPQMRRGGGGGVAHSCVGEEDGASTHCSAREGAA